eukprot:354143-Chlamydomonas_euryale.AAC.2
MVAQQAHATESCSVGSCGAADASSVRAVSKQHGRAQAKQVAVASCWLAGQSPAACACTHVHPDRACKRGCAACTSQQNVVGQSQYSRRASQRTSSSTGTMLANVNPARPLPQIENVTTINTRPRSSPRRTSVRGVTRPSSVLCRSRSRRSRCPPAPWCGCCSCCGSLGANAGTRPSASSAPHARGACRRPKSRRSARGVLERRAGGGTPRLQHTGGRCRIADRKWPAWHGSKRAAPTEQTAAFIGRREDAAARGVRASVSQSVPARPSARAHVGSPRGLD